MLLSVMCTRRLDCTGSSNTVHWPRFAEKIKPFDFLSFLTWCKVENNRGIVLGKWMDWRDHQVDHVTFYRKWFFICKSHIIHVVFLSKAVSLGLVSLSYYVCIVCTLPFCRGWEGQAPDQIFKKRCLTGSQFLEGLTWKEGRFFSGCCSFCIKNELKSEMFNDKKSL